MKNIKNHILTPNQTSLITLIERFQGAFEATKLQSPALIEGLKNTSIITSSGASTRIEGATFNDKEVKELVDKGCKINKMSSRSEREVAGYVKALNYIYDNLGKLDISEKTIREIHQLLTSELTESQLPSKQRGNYKDITNDVVETDPQTGKVIKVWFKTTPPGPATQVAMKNFISDYNKINSNNECHPLILIGGLIVKFLAIHPFRDGNGRLSRLLTTLLLLNHGYVWSQYTSHEKIIEDNKEGYYVSLRDTQKTLESDNPDYQIWLDFFLKIVLKQTEFLKGKIAEQSPIPTMNENEKKVFEVIKAVGKCKISYLLEQSDMSRPGLKSLLKRLIDQGIIYKEGKGKGTTYSVKSN